MDAWRRRFTRNVIAFTFLLQVPFGVLLGAALARTGAAPYAAALAAGAIFFLHTPMFLRLASWTDHERSGAARVWLFETPFYVHFVSSLLFGPLGLVALLALGVARLARHGIAVLPVLAAMYGVALTLGAYATLVLRFWVRVRRVELRVDGLDPALDGVRLVQLPDLHCGPYMPRAYLTWLARRANAEAPDVTLLTGDMINHGTGYVDDVAHLARSLRAPLGVFGAMGNHDYFGAHHEVADAMRAGGARVLCNEGVSVPGPRGGSLFVAAIDDSWTRRDDVDGALAGRTSRDGATVLIAHDPEVFDRVARRGDVDVVLSGHTHGGQFAMPFAARRWNLARLRYRYTLGLYRAGRAWLYVHAGNGTSGPPARFGVAPEIAVLTLRRE
ncbi:MAG: metallophosphoesterase [Deltaproteobacteria bacterium]